MNLKLFFDKPIINCITFFSDSIMSKALAMIIVAVQNAFPEYRFIVLRFRVVVAPLQSGSIKMTIKDGKKLSSKDILKQTNNYLYSFINSKGRLLGHFVPI